MGSSNPDSNQLKKTFTSPCENKVRMWPSQGWWWLLEIPAPLTRGCMALEGLHGSRDCTERPVGVHTINSCYEVIPGLWDSWHNLSHMNHNRSPWHVTAAFTLSIVFLKSHREPQPPTINNPIQTGSMNLKHTQTGPKIFVIVVCSLRAWLCLLFSCPQTSLSICWFNFHFLRDSPCCPSKTAGSSQTKVPTLRLHVKQINNKNLL